MSGGLALHRLQFLINVYFASLIRKLVKHKFWDYIRAKQAWRWAHSLSINFVGLDWAIMIASIGSKFCLRKEFPKNMAK